MIEPTPNLEELRARGAMTWADEERAWMARPDDVVNALSSGGFQECKRESTRSGRDREATGGVWQGLNASTGAVASAVWVRPEAAADGPEADGRAAAADGRAAAAPDGGALVFIDIDGERVTGR